MGAAIKLGEERGTWTRSDLVVTTKLFFGTGGESHNAKGLSRKHIVEGLAASLGRLQLSYVDVLYCHRPDPVTPLEETVRAMAWAIDKGHALYWGTSEWSARDITEACRIADALALPRPITEQPEYNLFARQRVEVEYAPLYQAYGLGLTTWSPLASGVLTGKYAGRVIPEGSRLSLPSYAFLTTAKMGADAWQVDATESLAPIAAELGCSRAALAVAWCLKNPHVSSVILGATSLAQLVDNLAALDVLPLLTADVMRRIEEAATPAALPKQSKVDAQVAGIRGVAGLSGLDLGAYKPY